MGREQWRRSQNHRIMVAMDSTRSSGGSEKPKCSELRTNFSTHSAGSVSAGHSTEPTDELPNAHTCDSRVCAGNTHARTHAGERESALGGGLSID